MPVFLPSLALRNYRGIGPDYQVMPSFKKFNFFIGANNAGKSSVLNFISKYLPPRFQGRSSYERQEPYVVDPLEHHGASSSSTIGMAIGFSVEKAFSLVEAEHSLALDRATAGFQAIGRVPTNREILKKLLEKLVVRDGLLWKTSKVPYGESLALQRPDAKNLATFLPHIEWVNLWTALTRQNGGEINHWTKETLDKIDAVLTISLPSVHLIPAIRQIGPKGAEFLDYSGVGLIDRLASIQNPEYNQREDRKKFDKVNGFLRFVTGKLDAEIEVPASREHVLVHMDGRVLPLSSLGTGIHEVVMIAAFCTLADHQIICIEEPEIHLHPLLQRKLVGYLASETQNQYFIATHSAAFIDTPDAAIFHVFQKNGTTHISEAVLRQQRHAICLDLGHRASDIVQANAIIWVEGPSDRVYVKHWLKIAAPELSEGVHFSIMFYGGRLLSHLSASDEEVTEFIQLRDLNRHVAIIMDSDKPNARARINDTKRRLKNDFDVHGGVAWVTKGREIENYIDHARLQRAVKAVYKDAYVEPSDGSMFDHALYFKRTPPKRTKRGAAVGQSAIKTDVDKVKVSHAVANDGSQDLDVLDLKQRIDEIVRMIRNANA